MFWNKQPSRWGPNLFLQHSVRYFNMQYGSPKRQPVQMSIIRTPETKENSHNCTVCYMCSTNVLYSSPNIVWVIKSRRMRWAGHVARMGEARAVYRVLVRKLEGKRPLGRPRLDGWILRRISRRWDVGIWTGLGWPKIETGGVRLWVR